MDKVIYIDVLLSVNFLVDWFLIRLAGKLGGAKSSKIRICLGALIGSLFSLTILLPRMNAIFSYLFSAMCAAVMCAVSFGVKRIKTTFRAFMWLYMLSACYAGIMIAVWFLLCPSGMEINNGFVYLDIKPEAIILCAVLCYAVISLLSRYGKIKNKDTVHCRLLIEHKGRKASLDGLVDTGNLLTEPISGLPVIIAASDAVSDIVPSSLCSFKTGAAYVKGEKLRLVPYKTIAGDNLGAAFLPDRITVICNGEQNRVNAYLLPIENMENDSLCSAIVGAQVLKM